MKLDSSDLFRTDRRLDELVSRSSTLLLGISEDGEKCLNSYLEKQVFLNRMFFNKNFVSTILIDAYFRFRRSHLE